MGGRTRAVAAIVVASLTGLHPLPAVGSEPPPGEASRDPSASTGDDPGDTEADLEQATSPADVAAAEAQRHFIEGQALYQEGKYDQAAAEFRRSYTALPTPTALYNMALAEERAGDAVAAVRSYRSYLTLNGLAPERRAEVEEVLEKLERRVGEIDMELEAGVELREIRVDDRVVPESDFPILVVPGEIKVELVGVGSGERRVRKYLVDGGQRLQIEVYPFKTAPQPAAPGPAGAPPPGTEVPASPEPDRAERRAQVSRQLFWAGLALTGAGGVTVGVLGGLGKSAEKEFNRKKCAEVCTDPDAHPFPSGLQERAARLELATNIAIGVTAGLALGTAIVGAIGFSRRPRGRSATRLAPAPGGISFHF